MPTIKTTEEADALIEALLKEKPCGKYWGYYGVELKDMEPGRAMLSLDRDSQAGVVHRLAFRLVQQNRAIHQIRQEMTTPGRPAGPLYGNLRNLTELVVIALRGLLKRKLPLSDKAILELLGIINENDHVSHFWPPLSGISSAIENRAAEGPLSPDLVSAIKVSVQKLQSPHASPEIRKAIDRMTRASSEDAQVQIHPGEAWSDAALEDLAAMDDATHKNWSALLSSCQSAGTGKTTAKWLKEVKPLIAVIGHDELKRRLLRWLPLVDRPRTQPKPKEYQWEPDYDLLIESHHVDLLKGLAWCAGLVSDRELARNLSALALSAYRKIPGRGPRLISLGHAAITALGRMPGMDAVGQLALLKVKVKFIPARKEVEKALNAAAEREGLPREEIDELAVPAYGMEEVGHRREVLGDYAVDLHVEGQDAELKWSKAAAGKPLKSVPTAVKKAFAEDVKELQAAVKDIGKMLTAQRERIDGLFLLKAQWPFETWRERYLDHPLVGTIARRLIWAFSEGENTKRAGIFLGGQIVCVDDRPLEGLGPETTVELWHPIDWPVDAVLAWRDWLDRHQVRQPFKQAHREVYILTDAERHTQTYSNRFAAHILRQHQYHALCAARGWRNRLRLMVDDTYPPSSKDLPEWGLRAEYWVEGIGDDDGRDTTESGSYLYLSTDQVRFYQIGAAQKHAHAWGGGYASSSANPSDAEPVPIDAIPPLVLSEILRDVDLFVGVASVGNDPAWNDGGPDGRHLDYWQGYSFGDLTANGQTRKAVLERLIPRLKIGPRCLFTDKFLVVRGDLRTYKIHLGSGNILMEPNDQYLCIVPRRGGADSSLSGVFLPFEGDNTLSIVLSKALLLADDTKITDMTIVNQIRR